MDPIKIAGLVLKSEPQNAGADPVNISGGGGDEDYITTEGDILTKSVYHIKETISLTEGLPSTDKTIKALAKLKGALELLNS